MQFFVRLHFGNIIAIEQPVDLFTGQGDDGFTRLGPFELFFGQGFIVEYEAIQFPLCTVQKYARNSKNTFLIRLL